MNMNNEDYRFECKKDFIFEVNPQKIYAFLYDEELLPIMKEDGIEFNENDIYPVQKWIKDNYLGEFCEYHENDFNEYVEQCYEGDEARKEDWAYYLSSRGV